MTEAKDGLVIRPADEADLPAVGRLGGALVRAHHAFDRARFMTPPARVEEGYAWFLGTQLGEAGVVVLVAEQVGRPGAKARRSNGRARRSAGGAPKDARSAEIVGYVYAGLEPESWKELRGPAGFIHDVVVADGARGRGVGARLVEAAAGWLVAHGAPRVMLWSAEKNAPAQAFFERLGFRRTMVEMTREPKR